MKEAILSHFISQQGIVHFESLERLIEEKQKNIALKGNTKVIS